MHDVVFQEEKKNIFYFATSFFLHENGKKK